MPKLTRKTKIILLVTAVLLLMFIKIEANINARSNPPAVCYLVGGHWNFWNGWTCG